MIDFFILRQHLNFFILRSSYDGFLIFLNFFYTIFIIFYNSTRKLFYILGNIHDLELFFNNLFINALSGKLFSSHWGHISIIFLWVSSLFFYIAWNGNYLVWLKNPIFIISIGHIIFDFHFLYSIYQAYSSIFLSFNYIIFILGIYNYLFSIGLCSEYDIYVVSLLYQILALVILIIGRFQFFYTDYLLIFKLYPLYLSICCNSRNKFVIFIVKLPLFLFLLFFKIGIRLNCYIGVLIGFISLLWSGHLVYIVIPLFKSVRVYYFNVLSVPSFFKKLFQIFNLNWVILFNIYEKIGYIFGLVENIFYFLLLSFIGGLNNSIFSLFLIDISHHYLVLGIVLIWVSNFYKSIFLGLGYRISNILKLNALLFFKEVSYNGFLLCFKNSINLQLALALFSFGIIISLVVQHMYLMNSYIFLSFDYVNVACLYVHYQYVSSLFMLGAFIHKLIFLV